MNFLKDPRTNWKYILIVAILAVIVGGGIWWWQKNMPQPEAITILPQDETADWKTYNSGQDIMGFSLNVPAGWIVKFREEGPFSNQIKRLVFDLAPPSIVKTTGWMGWGSLYIDIYDSQIDIDKWIEENLPEFKNELIIKKISDVGGKSTFSLDRKEGFWVPHYVILGDRYS